jgi:hypothetical protein
MIGACMLSPMLSEYLPSWQVKSLELKFKAPIYEDDHIECLLVEYTNQNDNAEFVIEIRKGDKICTVGKGLLIRQLSI